jgi:cell division protein FtsI (penicillin-binding protein 3)
MAFGGAEVMVTPLGMAAALNTVANDGVYIKPEVIRWIESPVDGTRSAFPDSVSRRVISSRTAAQMQDIMRGVTEDAHGTGSRARVEGVSVAGKTGTAKKWDSSLGAYSSKKIIASFGGFLPADDPRITIYVMVDEPKGDTYGGLVAAPVFARIAEQTVDYLGIPRDRDGPATGVESLASTRGLMMEDTRHRRNYQTGRMPLVLGMTMGEASQALARCGFAPRIKGSGYVIWQDPPGGVRSEPGSECELDFAPPPLEK